VAQVLVGLGLVPPTFRPGQGVVAAAQPHLAAQQGGIEFGNFLRGQARLHGGRWLTWGAIQPGRVIGGHGDQLDLHGNAREAFQVTGGAAIAQQQEPPWAAQTLAGEALEDVGLGCLPAG